jgi:hypothetical protein
MMAIGSSAILLFGGCIENMTIRHDGRSTSFYIAAHPDDIELFMGRNAWLDVQAGTPKVVFLVLTAGDAGNFGDAYWRAREEGHLRALRFWASMNGAVPAPMKRMPVVLGNYTLDRITLGDRLVAYNLRLPDGSPTGGGYPSTSNQSLKRLREGTSESTIRSVDGALIFTYSQLKALIGDLIAVEARQTTDVWANIQDEDPFRNPIDHADHRATALTVIDALNDRDYSCVSIARYLDYVIETKPSNFSEEERRIHAGTWGALNSGRVDGGQATTWDGEHLVWLGREYLRASPSGRQCNF